MAIQSQPSRIPEPFAGSGTKNTIPATNTTPSASQAASWASGFPPECSQPLSAGGCPVPRNDVNGALNQISQDYAFRQDGGVWEWSALADYDVSRVVRGSDGSLYCSVQQSGPSVAAGAQDPAADDGTYWTALPTDNADVVHRTGTEFVSGVKNFAADVDLGGGSGHSSPLAIACPGISIDDDASVPSMYNFGTLAFTDENGFDPDNPSASRVLSFLSLRAPSVSDDYFRFWFGINTQTYAGSTYVNDGSITLYATKTTGYVDTYNLMTHGAHPYYVFRMQNVGDKGSAITGNHYADILFCDDHPETSFGGTNQFGGINLRVYATSYIETSMLAYKNEANSTHSAGVRVRCNSSGGRSVLPGTSGEETLGLGTFPWGQIYSTSTSISTSDARLKTEPEAVPDEVLDAWGEVGFVQFQMLDSVAKKGAESARLHNGLIAQRIDEAFKAHGLDASRYGLFCHDEWEAEEEARDERGTLVREAVEAGDRYSLRYEEALCMEAAFQRRRADRAEGRLAALEERLAAIEAKLG